MGKAHTEQHNVICRDERFNEGFITEITVNMTLLSHNTTENHQHGVKLHNHEQGINCGPSIITCRGKPGLTERYDWDDNS